MDQLTLFVEDSPAKTYQWQDDALAWLESAADSGLSLHELLANFARNGLLLKTSLAYCPVIEDGTLPSSFTGWGNSGIYRPGESLTLSTSEWPSDAAVCSLSQVLETDAPLRYFLSPTACAGILRRAEKRGRELPAHLKAALEQVAMTPAHTEPQADT